MKHISRFIGILLAACMALAALPAMADRENLTEWLHIVVAPGEVQMVEAGDVTLEKGACGVTVDNEKGHAIVIAGHLNRPVSLSANAGSVIASYIDINDPATGALGWIEAYDGGFVSLTGGDCLTTKEQSQGFKIEEEGASAVRVQIGDAKCGSNFGVLADMKGGSTLVFSANEMESKGPFGFYADMNDRSMLVLNAKKLKNDGDYGLWIKSRGKCSGDESLVSVDVDELEGTGYALDLQQYGSGYYNTLRFGKVTAGDIALRIMLERGNATDILVEGDVTAGRIGVKMYSSDIIKLIVLGTISAGEAPILVADTSGMNGIGVNSDTQGILVWRIIPTASGRTVMLQGRETDSVTESDKTEVMEKAIRYIIRTEESDKAVITLKKEDGEDIRMSFGYPVACEGERVLVEVQAADGYKVTGVLNGEEEQVPLEKDENGSWYFDMPRGGGISLFAVTEPAT